MSILLLLQTVLILLQQVRSDLFLLSCTIADGTGMSNTLPLYKSFSCQQSLSVTMLLLCTSLLQLSQFLLDSSQSSEVSI